VRCNLQRSESVNVRRGATRQVWQQRNQVNGSNETQAGRQCVCAAEPGNGNPAAERGERGRRGSNAVNAVQ